MQDNLSVKYTEKLKEVYEPLSTLNKDICCASCEKLLVRSVQIKEIPKKEKYKFSCPFCGGNSFLITLDYKAHFQPVNCKIAEVTFSEEKQCQKVKLVVDQEKQSPDL